MIILFIELDLQSEIPIYTQLKSQIIEGIATGELKKGEALPSVRQLADDLGINLHTVNKTYTILKQLGFILVHRQKGVVVNPDIIPQATKEYKEELKNNLKSLILEAYCRGMTEKDFNVISAEIFNYILESRRDI